MHVAACVQPQKLARLRGAAGSDHAVYAALDWAHADSIIKRQPVDVLVVDPQFEGSAAPRTDRIRAVRHRYGALPMVVYSTLSAQTMRSLVELGTEGLGQIVLYGLDDDPRHLRQVLELQPGILLSERMVGLIRPRLNHTPSPVAGAVERAIRNPTVFRNVGDLTNAAGVPRRSFYRHLERAGLASPREVLAAARVLRAYALLRIPGYSLELAAAQVKFSDVDTLTDTMKAIAGVTPGRARLRIAPDEFLQMLTDRLVPRATRPAVPAGAEQADAGAAS
ncbi:MAG TPA: helix-turn-helix domain-containing protein [Gemmatimonadaceae bacterium]|nr:helix-turn-helix domain-containing protein [Gemmatimonadaceae bacterium]